jgi:hypothetical protein
VPLSNAEKQQAFRERRARYVAGLEQALADERAEAARLRRELAAVATSLAGTLAENERLSQPACRHPAEAVLNGRCHKCGTDLW